MDSSEFVQNLKFAVGLYAGACVILLAIGWWLLPYRYLLGTGQVSQVFAILLAAIVQVGILFFISLVLNVQHSAAYGLVICLLGLPAAALFFEARRRRARPARPAV